MKILVRDQKHTIFIPLPNCLAFSGLTASIAGSALKDRQDVPLSRDDLKKLFRVLRQARRDFGPLVLVDMESSDGEKVLITL